MPGFRKGRQRRFAFVTCCFALVLGLTQGCARSQPLRRGDTASPVTEQKLPFHSDTDPATSDGAKPAPVPTLKQASNVPFRSGSHSLILPAGTLLTVQLEDQLSSARVRAGDAFTATVTAPFTIDGEILLQGGTAVTGRVESVRSLPHRHSGSKSSGYFRLTLNSLTVENRQLPLQTSSLFARGTFEPSQGLEVRKGHRLTFRLTAPVAFDAPNSIAKQQSSLPSSE